MDVQQQAMLGGRYTLLGELGRGGMSVVWRARDEVLGRPVAVKVLAGRFAGDPVSRARIRDEARAAARLSPHANIAQVYDYGESSDNGVMLPYVVMELVDGPTLQQRVAAGPVPPRSAFRICAEVAAGLAAAHADGLVHRDIKPANVMVTANGAKVVDFGIAAVAGPGKPEEVLIGTPAYLAPERLTGGGVEPATDVYALGVLLYRLLSNESPWTVESTTQMLSAHIYIEPQPLPQLPGVPPAVTDLVARCLRKQPSERPSAARAAAILTAAANDAVRGDHPMPALPGMSTPSGSDFPGPAAVPPPGAAPPAPPSKPEVPSVRVVRGAVLGAAAAGGGVLGAAGGRAIGEGSGAMGAGGGAPGAGGGVMGAAEGDGSTAGGVTGTAARYRPGSGAAVGGAAADGSGASAGDVPGKADGGAAARGAAAPETRGGAAARGVAEEKRGGVAAPALRPPVGAGPSRIPAPRRAGRRRPPAKPPAGDSAAGEGRAEGSPVRNKKLIFGGAVAAAVIAVLLIVWLVPRGDDGERDATAKPPPGATAREPSSVAAVGGRTQPANGPTRGGDVGGGENQAPATVRPTAGSAAPGTSATGDTPPATSATSPPPAPEGTTLSSAGGTVVALCSGATAELSSVNPNEGYQVQKADRGPGLTTSVVFKKKAQRVRMTVTCVAGLPTAVNLAL